MLTSPNIVQSSVLVTIQRSPTKANNPTEKSMGTFRNVALSGKFIET